MAFMVCVAGPLRRRSRRRIQEIFAEQGLSDAPFQSDKVQNVPSVNSLETHAAMQQLDPKIVFVNGTRILTRETLMQIQAPVFNMHHGITPAYRGVHGGYWALADGRADLAGTTIHYVDSGIDTGGVVRHVPLPSVTARDNFATYPALHVASALAALVEIGIQVVDKNSLPPTFDPNLPSVLRTHPTLWQYLRNRIRRGVK